jgi:iron(III) transport system substrate-binding protein
VALVTVLLLFIRSGFMQPMQHKLKSLPGRRALSVLTLTLAVSSLAACGGGDEKSEVAENKITVEGVPEYYPAEYQEIVDASKKEGGELVIYSNTSEENWAPIFRDFKKKFPWVEKVSANDLDSDEVFQKILSEQATGSSPADLVVSNAAVGWADFAARDGVLMDYESPEIAEVPEFAQLLPNVFAMSTDPQTIAYNTELVPEAPTGISDLADMAEADPDTFQDKITVRDPESSFGYTVTEAYTSANPDGWDALEKVLPFTRAETSSGTQMEKILAGEYVAGFLISGGPAFPVVNDSDGLVETVYPDDGTVVLPRGIGIAADAPHPATSKLFIDFLMSEEGQFAVAEGGLSSYRENVSGEGLHTYQEVVDAVGEDGIVFVEYESQPKEDIDAWLERFYQFVEPAPEEE